ncbi:MAG: hypothetical protein HY513_02490 [Candidatus Aenigmarchaeota archaeon]|nr:hypothetical protein [Candidatus Aenigmarchaeota archaeon]
MPIKLSQNGKVLQVSLIPRGFKLPYPDLHEQTPISLYALAKAEGVNNFENPVAQAMEAFYQKRERQWYGLITRDVIEKGGRGVDNKGRLHLRVVSFDGIEGWEKTGEVWAPKAGYIVPTSDSDGTFAGLFHEGTPVPIETLPFEERDGAVARWEANGLNSKYLSGAYMQERIDQKQDNGKRLVGREFCPGSDVLGRFSVGLCGPSLVFGSDWIASLPPYESEPEVKLEL